MSTITSSAEFEQKIKNSNNDQLLLFYNNQSNASRVNGYRIVGLKAAVSAGHPIEVYRINIQTCQLSSADKKKYLLGNQVICCTTINDGIVMEKIVDPLEFTLRHMVLAILV